jgi:hypothetical protein
MADSRRNHVNKIMDEFRNQGSELSQRYLGAWNSQYLPAEVQVPLGYVPLPRQAAALRFPQVTAVSKTVFSYDLKDGAAPIQEIFIIGEGLNAVQEISCAFGSDVVEWVTLGGARDGLLTQINDHVIQLRLRVKKSAVLSFELTLDPKLLGNGGNGLPPVVRTPPVTFIVNKEVPTVEPPLSTRASFRAPRQDLLPPIAPPAAPSPAAIIPASTAPVLEPQLIDPLDMGISLMPEPIPVARATRPKR